MDVAEEVVMQFRCFFTRGLLFERQKFGVFALVLLTLWGLSPVCSHLLGMQEQKGHQSLALTPNKHKYDCTSI